MDCLKESKPELLDLHIKKITDITDYFKKSGGEYKKYRSGKN